MTEKNAIEVIERSIDRRKSARDLHLKRNDLMNLMWTTVSIDVLEVLRSELTGEPPRGGDGQQYDAYWHDRLPDSWKAPCAVTNRDVDAMIAKRDSSPFQIRVKLLEIARDIVSSRAFNSDGSEKLTAEAVIAEAERLNAFISRRG